MDKSADACVEHLSPFGAVFVQPLTAEGAIGSFTPRVCETLRRFLSGLIFAFISVHPRFIGSFALMYSFVSFVYFACQAIGLTKAGGRFIFVFFVPKKSYNGLSDVSGV